VDANGGHEEDLKDVSCFEVHSWNRGSAEIMLYREQISIKMERRRKEWWGCWGIAMVWIGLVEMMMIKKERWVLELN
jgi:hypothetical protein